MSKLNIYKILTLVLFAFLLMAIYHITTGNVQYAVISFAAAIASVLTQAALIKCSNCGTRPGWQILAIWTLLLDFELYVADVLWLKECPKCKKSLNSRN